MHTILPKDFFARDTITVANELLGKRLVRVLNGIEISTKIVEVEAYLDENDPASHARFGPKGRSRVMFEEAGTIYVYLIYGIYHCLNFVTEPKGKAGAVLIRALEPLQFAESLVMNGPGKLSKALNIDLSINGLAINTPLSNLYIMDEGQILNEKQVVCSGRIGVKIGNKEKLRFFIKDNSYVSAK